jgi:hypothetical protein
MSEPIYNPGREYHKVYCSCGSDNIREDKTTDEEEDKYGCCDRIGCCVRAFKCMGCGTRWLFDLVEFVVDYYKTKDGERTFSHRYTEWWELTEFFCPSCGEKHGVWRDTSGGDYYVGEEYLCIWCEAVFYLPSGARPSNNEHDVQRLNAIKQHVVRGEGRGQEWPIRGALWKEGEKNGR